MIKKKSYRAYTCKQVDNICYIYERDCKRSAFHCSALLTAPILGKNSCTKSKQQIYLNPIILKNNL